MLPKENFCKTVTLPLRYYQLLLVFLSHDLERESFTDNRNTERKREVQRINLRVENK